MKKVIVCILLSIVSLDIYAQDLASFQERRNGLIKSLKDVDLLECGWHGLPKAIARLSNNPDDQVALNYIANILDHKDQGLFDFPGVALALCRYWDHFSPGQINAIKSDLERLAKKGKNEYKNKEPGGEGFLGHGTENHNTCMWCSGYLFGQLFPDANWANGISSQELMDEMKQRLQQLFKSMYERGYREYLSSTYEVVMDFPVYILYEYAKEPEMKAIAEAFLIYKWTLLSLNNYEGYILAPYGRMNTDQDFKPEESYVSAAPYMNWLYWGGPKTQIVEYTDFIDYPETSFAIYIALSNVVPDDMFFRLGNNSGTPYSQRSSTPYEKGTPNRMMRQVYRDSLFAIGTGNFRWVPNSGGSYHNDNGFSIVWHSPDRFNYIGCFQPYWYSDGDTDGLSAETWYKGNMSPFQQTAQYHNTVITLFDIPKKDPWPNLPDSKHDKRNKWLWRDGHADGLIQRGMLRYPKSIDEKTELKGWIFLREGETYIGIKPLREYYTQTNLTGKGLDGFNIVKSDFPKTGFVFELGTENEFGSFKKFQRKLSGNYLKVDWDNFAVTYSDSKGNTLKIHYNEGLSVDPDGLYRSMPTVWLNGEKDPAYDQWPISWPLLDCPYAKLDNSILSIQQGQTKIKVDWQGEYPKIERQK